MAIYKTGTITNNQEVLTDYQHASGCTKDYIEIQAGGVIKKVTNSIIQIVKKQ